MYRINQEKDVLGVKLLKDLIIMRGVNMNDVRCVGIM